jgi:hypothetical protein
MLMLICRMLDATPPQSKFATVTITGTVTGTPCGFPPLVARSPAVQACSKPSAKFKRMPHRTSLATPKQPTP